jgi:hypothetical protein
LLRARGWLASVFFARSRLSRRIESFAETDLGSVMFQVKVVIGR